MQKVIDWKLFRFTDLSTELLYEILSLRARVFIVEQDSPYLDPDYKDQSAGHLCGFCEGKVTAYCRLFRAGGYFEQASVGRVVVDPDYRRWGLGQELMRRALEIMGREWNEKTIVISAQLYLQRFYESFGFRQVSETYQEDGIPHIRMKRVTPDTEKSIEPLLSDI